MENKLKVALILKPQGIRGEIKVKIYTDSAEALSAFKTVYIGGNSYKVLNCRGFDDCAYLMLKGIADRNQAELLRGQEVFVLREDAPELPDGRYYIVDLIGCEVVDEDGEKIGVMQDVIPAKTDIYTVKIDGKDVMFAGVEGVIQSIDINERTITVNRKKFNEVAVLD
ncbi:MAG: 16S rRNA processing protein RimM [Clostridiales bacterium]|nr:16S rRNA processing protein RimM [Clostridiales bacterium]